ADTIRAMRDDVLNDAINQHIAPGSMDEQWDVPGLEKSLGAQFTLDLPLQQWLDEDKALHEEGLRKKICEAADALYQEKEALVGPEGLRQFERSIMLQSLDSHWREHLSALDHLRQGIHLRGYAQKQPKQEYKREAFELFGQLLDAVKNDVTKVLMTVKVQSNEQLGEAAEAMESRAESIANVTYTAPTETGEVEVRSDAAPRGPQTAADLPRVGRNDPCPCGSGNKYKLCHGKLA
ncbi:MAG: SEC-C metal-binding domain-containing protein, partial [Rhodoferax sp.]|uniref:SEC-C metal-binding domain-containing protein n=1 Tax=Rhodoferax sp. TaxID=50421 RepID=UPI0032655BD4